MKKDWSVFRITVLLYAVVVLLPLNYYFAVSSFESMKNDPKTMNNLVYINGAMQRVSAIADLVERDALIEGVTTSLNKIDNDFLKNPNNIEFVKLFRADESFDAVKRTWINLKSALNDDKDLAILSQKCGKELNHFALTIEDMLEYKSKNMLDRLYLSLIFTMLIVIAIIFFIRMYIHIQIEKHAIHDHVTGLYNQSYYKEALQTAKSLSTRRKSPLSLIVLSLVHYDACKKKMGPKQFRQFLQKFSAVLIDDFRQSDVVCRIEENSFVIITPDASLENTEKLVLRLIEHLKQHSFNHQIIELRIGVASYDNSGKIDLFEEAKKKMDDNSSIVIGSAL